jgi:hypothetical protein
MFQEHIRPEFSGILADNKVYFNCHPFEVYAFLDSSPVQVLESITSIVLGDELVLEKYCSIQKYNYWSTQVDLPLTEPWASKSEPSAYDYDRYVKEKENRDKYYNYYDYELALSYKSSKLDLRT